MTADLMDLFDELPDCLGGHMLLTVTALAVGLALSVPLGIWASRRPRTAEAFLGGAGILQTIPSLALLALMVPLLGGTIGFWPAFCALTLYSLLPILANTIVGLRGVDPRVVDAGRGLGMSEWQLLRRVRLPLAAPIILAGVRTATVLLVGTATLATPVGQQTLGNYIFEGLNIRNQAMVLFGCVLAALLAVLLDQLIRLLEMASRRRRLSLWLIGLVGLAVLVGGSLWRPVVKWLYPPSNLVIVGSADYTEQHILAEVMRGRLTEAGFTVERRKNLAILFEAVCNGNVDCCVEFTGNIWAREMHRQEPATPEATFRAVKEFLWNTFGVECLGKVGFQNAYALAMRQDKAQELHITNLEQLSRHTSNLSIAGDLQFFKLPEWRRVKETYGLSFREAVAMDGTLMYQALQSGAVDVIVVYTSDGRIAADRLVVLKDCKQAFPSYEAILLLSPQAGTKAGLRKALSPLVGAITIDRMREANALVDRNHVLPQQVGRQLLRSIALRDVQLDGKGAATP
jgi:osmoprotectant transport system permease protein